MARLEVIVAGLTFPEAPRWRDGRLWFSDFYDHAVYSVDLAGKCVKAFDLPDQPSGLGWLADGTLLVVSMLDQKVLRWDRDELTLHADLARLARNSCNDMIVMADGSAYVGNFGFDPRSEKPHPTNLIRISPAGTATIAASDLQFPNGMCTLHDETVLIVAESVGQCLTAFDILPGGVLANRRVFATTPGCLPDGICVDGEGNVLVTTMTCNRLIKFSPAGKHLETLEFDVPLWACAVSGRGDVLLCTSHHSAAEDCRRERSSAIQRVMR